MRYVYVFTHRDHAALFHCHQHHRERAPHKCCCCYGSSSSKARASHIVWMALKSKTNATEECARDPSPFMTKCTFSFFISFSFFSDFIFQVYSFSLNCADVCLCPFLSLSLCVCVGVCVSAVFSKSNGILHSFRSMQFTFFRFFRQRRDNSSGSNALSKLLYTLGWMAANGTLRTCYTSVRNASK